MSTDFISETTAPFLNLKKKKNLIEMRNNSGSATKIKEPKMRTVRFPEEVVISRQTQNQ
jgi:hypothetical protein